MLAVGWPVMWLAFLPVVAIESFVAVRTLGLRFRQALAVTAAANAISTFVGIPVTWFILVVLELIIPNGGQWQPVVARHSGLEGARTRY